MFELEGKIAVRNEKQNGILTEETNDDGRQESGMVKEESNAI